MFEQLLHTKESLLLMFSIPLYIIVISLEIILSNIHNKHLYNTKDTLVNIYLSCINFALDVFLRTFAFFILSFFFTFHFFKIENQYLYWFVLLFVEDFMYYWEHRVDHYVRFFWAIHVTHHSSQLFNLTTGFRSSALQPLYRFIYFIPLALIGFSAPDIMFMYALTQIYGILIHTKSIDKLGLLEYFMATPSHHRVHHASNEKYLDKNMGMVFIIWDKLFSTFEEEDGVTVIEYGLTKNVTTPYHPLKIVTHEWLNLMLDVRNEKNIKNKLLFLVKRPGWKPR